MTRFENRLHLAGKTATRIYQAVARIDAVKGQWHIANTLSPQMVERLRTSVIVTSTGASTRIEGSQLSDQDVKKLFQKQNIKSFKSRDEQEVGGYLEVLKLVFEQWEDITFSESTILSLHQMMLGYSDKDKRHKGVYKFGSNRVEARDHDGQLVGVIFDPTPPHLVPKEMSELMSWTQAELATDNFPSLLVISNFVFEFLAIHPFQDGNGRMSRILTNLLLLQAGYEFAPFVSHEKIIEDNKADYYVALNTTQQSWKTETEDLTPWLTFFLDVLTVQSQNALKLMQEEPVDLFLSDMQKQIWDYITTQDTVSRREIIDATDLNVRTISHTLRKLVEMNKIESIGQGKATRYRLKK